MSENMLARIYEHNNWANLQIVDACAALTGAQLDAEPQTASYGSIRSTLIHLAEAQQNYLRLLTLPLEARQERLAVDYADLRASIIASGDGLLALTRDASGLFKETQLHTRDGHHVEPWVLLVQVINHATEHREQIKNMLTLLGIEPPSIDGWDYGSVTGALVKISA
jgi:uncharacterized damage-inducible protein DinB